MSFGGCPYDYMPGNPETTDSFYAAICPECGESHGYLAEECKKCGAEITEDNYQYR